MPELTKVLTPEDVQRRGGATSLDLSPYLAILAGVREQGGVGGVLTLGEDEEPAHRETAHVTGRPVTMLQRAPLCITLGGRAAGRAPPAEGG